MCAYRLVGRKTFGEEGEEGRDVQVEEEEEENEDVEEKKKNKHKKKKKKKKNKEKEKEEDSEKEEEEPVEVVGKAAPGPTAMVPTGPAEEALTMVRLARYVSALRCEVYVFLCA